MIKADIIRLRDAEGTSLSVCRGGGACAVSRWSWYSSRGGM